MLVLKDVAAKMFREYPFKTRSGDEVFSFFRNWVEYTLKTYPGDHTLRHYHADGGAELMNRRIKSIIGRVRHTCQLELNRHTRA